MLKLKDGEVLREDMAHKRAKVDLCDHVKILGYKIMPTDQGAEYIESMSIYCKTCKKSSYIHIGIN
jgi:hypothetical protein